MRNILSICIFFLFSAGSISAQALTFLIDNKVTTSTEVTFDVLLSSDSPFKLGSGQLYFNFNTDAFGEWVATNNRLTISYPSGSVLGQQYLGFLDIYDTFIENDNTANRFSFSWQQGFSSGAIAADNITSTAAVLFQVSIEFDTGGSGEPDDLCFESGNAFDDQTFTACGPTTAASADCFNEPGTQLTDDNFQCSPALPIELVNFTAQANTNFTTLLKWQTAREYQNDYFTIERSFDGHHFAPILKVAGAGDSQQFLFYEDLDQQPQVGINYYRLKQSDFNGKYSYSQIQSVTFAREEAIAVKVFPNPAKDLLNIDFDDYIQQARVQIFNGAGQILREQILEEDIKQTQLQLDQLSPGIYWIRVEADGEFFNQRVMISRQ